MMQILLQSWLDLCSDSWTLAYCDNPPPGHQLLVNVSLMFHSKKWVPHTLFLIWLVVSTPLKNISQNGNLPQIGVRIKKYLKPPPRLFLLLSPKIRVMLQDHPWKQKIHSVYPENNKEAPIFAIELYPRTKQGLQGFPVINRSFKPLSGLDGTASPSVKRGDFYWDKFVSVSVCWMFSIPLFFNQYVAQMSTSGSYPKKHLAKINLNHPQLRP